MGDLDTALVDVNRTLEECRKELEQSPDHPELVMRLIALLGLREKCLTAAGRLEEALTDQNSLIEFYGQCLASGAPAASLSATIESALQRRAAVLQRLGRLAEAKRDTDFARRLRK